MNLSYIEDLMEKRRPKYEAAADITVVTDGKTAEEICGEILGKCGKIKKGGFHMGDYLNPGSKGFQEGA